MFFLSLYFQIYTNQQVKYWEMELMLQSALTETWKMNKNMQLK